MSGLVLGQIRYFSWSDADVTLIGPGDTWLHALGFMHRGVKQTHTVLNLYGFPTEQQARASARTVQALARSGGMPDRVLFNRVRPLHLLLPTTTTTEERTS